MEWLWSFDLRYYGADFVGMALSFGSIWQLARKRRSGFLFGATASVAWLVFGVMAKSAGTVYANAIFGVMHAYAWWRWKHEVVTSTGR
jgi:hypothetical protein